MPDAGERPVARYRPPDPRDVRLVVAGPPGPRPAVPAGATRVVGAPVAAPPPVVRTSARRTGSTFGVGFTWGLTVSLVIGMVAVIGWRPAPSVLEPETPVQAIEAPTLGTPPDPAVVVTLGAGPLDDPALLVAPTACPLPPMGVSNAAVEAWVQASVTCLDAVWEPLLGGAGVDHTRPLVRRYDTGVVSSCIGEVWTAFYCGPERRISISPSSELNTVPDADRAGRLLAVMAHEYGHHLQELSGTGPAAAVANTANEAGGEAWLEVSRRVELQATCLAGVSFTSMTGRGSVSAADLRQARLRSASGDLPGAERDHGTAEHNLLWFDRGVAAGRPAACNTWVAAAADVA